MRGLDATPTSAVRALPLSTPLQRHLIMKTLTHLHGCVWSKLHSKPHQIRIICECKTLFFLFLAPPPSLRSVSSAGHMFKWWRGNLQFFNVLWRPEPRPIPPPEWDHSHPQLSQDLICTPPTPPAHPTPKLDWASSDWFNVQAAH